MNNATTNQIFDTLIHQKKQPTSDIIERFVRRKITILQDPVHIHRFFTNFYDQLYHDILFRNIHLERRTIRMLEALAIPPTTTFPLQIKKILAKIEKKKK